MKRASSHLAIILSILGVLLGAALLLLAIRPAVAELVGVTPLPPITRTDGRAGACYSFYHHPEGSSQRPFLPLAYDAGSRWDRFDFSWPSLEPSRDSWNWGPHDTLVNDLRSAGVSMVGILQMTPQWAATGCGVSTGPTPGGAAASDRRLPSPQMFAQAVAPSDTWGDWWTKTPPQGLYLSWDHPDNQWGHYVYNVVSHYSGMGVKHWEMWNEAEWDLFWCGSEADYARLLKVGYLATKSACPDCTVLFAGLHYWDDPTFFEDVLDVLNDDPDGATHNYFFDVMSVHFYSRPSDVYYRVRDVRSRMQLYVPDHPLWLTETGVPVWDDGSVDPDPGKYDFAATQDEAAAYVIQSYANGWAAGIERYFFFRTHDADTGEYFGLVRNDYSLRPSYVAYQVAATYLISPTFVTHGLVGAQRNVTLWDTPHGKVSVLWNESPATSVYTLPAALPTATLVDRLGVTETVTATAGVYTFTLPAATANRTSPNESDYFIGGDPLVVVEAEVFDEPPTSAVDALPATVYTMTFAVTWQGRDDESGVWFYDVQVRDGESGEWAEWLPSTPLTSSQFSGQHAHTYYFRSRAVDRVGNREDWPTEPQAHMAFDLASTFYFTVGTFFADENRDALWDAPITDTGEITLTGVTLRLLDAAGQGVVSPTVGSAFTATVFAGQSYQVWATITDYVRILPFFCPLGGQVYTQTHPLLGLVPITRVYLPVVVRDAIARDGGT